MFIAEYTRKNNITGEVVQIHVEFKTFTDADIFIDQAKTSMYDHSIGWENSNFKIEATEGTVTKTAYKGWTINSREFPMHGYSTIINENGEEHHEIYYSLQAAKCAITKLKNGCGC